MPNVQTKIVTAFLFICAAVITPPAQAQNGYAMPAATTLSVAQNSASPYLCLTSTTNIFAPTLGVGTISDTNAGTTMVIVDSEPERVIGAPNSGCFPVQRGYSGGGGSIYGASRAVFHNSGAVAIVGLEAQFFDHEPRGACTAATEVILPRYVTNTETLWTCPTSGPTANIWTMSGVFNGRQFTFTDSYEFVGANGPCVGTTSGTAGTGNNTVILDGSTPALKISSTNAGASTSTLTCNVADLISRTTAGKGSTITGFTVVYSVQTTTATSMGTPTLTSVTFPTPAASETASTATPVAAAGGTLTMTPAVASANLTAVSAGQYYTESISLGTPLQLNNALKNYLLTFTIGQTASAAQIVTIPGIYVSFTNVPQ